MRKRNLRRLRAVLAHLPYGSAVRIMRSLSGSAAIRRLLFPRTTRLVKDVYRRHCGIACDDRTVQLLIMSKALTRPLAREIEEFSDRDFARHVRVNGLETLQDLCASDRGVLIVAAHYSSARAILPVINRHGIRPYYLARSGPGRGHGERQITTYDKAPFFGLKEVQKVLKDGGQVYALPDGRQGTSEFAHHFLGRDCHFKGGILNLAQRLGAAIVPVSSYMEIDGHVVVDFHPPLQVGDSRGPRESPAEGLVHAYADFLEAAIRTRPWCFDPGRLELFWSGTGRE